MHFLLPKKSKIHTTLKKAQKPTTEKIHEKKM